MLTILVSNCQQLTFINHLSIVVGQLPTTIVFMTIVDQLLSTVVQWPLLPTNFHWWLRINFRRSFLRDRCSFTFVNCSSMIVTNQLPTTIFQWSSLTSLWQPLTANLDYYFRVAVANMILRPNFNVDRYQTPFKTSADKLNLKL